MFRRQTIIHLRNPVGRGHYLHVSFTELEEDLSPETLVEGFTKAGKELEVLVVAGVCAGADGAAAGCGIWDRDWGSIMRIALDFVGRMNVGCGYWSMLFRE